MPHTDVTVSIILHPAPTLMTRLSLSQRVLWVAVAAVASPLALLFLARPGAGDNPIDLSVANDDLYTDLFDGQMN